MSVLLTRDAEPSVLVAYVASKHPALTPLLPQDTKPEDLFNRVGHNISSARIRALLRGQRHRIWVFWVLGMIVANVVPRPPRTEMVKQ